MLERVNLRKIETSWHMNIYTALLAERWFALAANRFAVIFALDASRY
jgi:hypothetical protein